MGLLSGGLKMVGSYLGYKASDKGYKNAIDAARFKPFNVRSGFGSATFNGQDATASLSPEYQAMRDRMLSLSGGLFSNINPEQTTNNALGLLRGLAQPDEGRQYADLESRLYGQGMLGAGDATGANPTMRAFFEARNKADMARQLQAISLGEGMMTNRIHSGMGLLSGAQGLDKSVLDMINMGFGGGAQQAAAGANVAKYEVGRGDNKADFLTGLFDSMAGMTQGMK